MRAVLAIDVAVVVGALALGLAGAITLRVLWRKSRAEVPEVRGAENARREAEANARRCHFCKEPIDPAVDLYIEPHWYHRACNRHEGNV